MPSKDYDSMDQLYAERAATVNRGIIFAAGDQNELVQQEADNELLDYLLEGGSAQGHATSSLMQSQFYRREYGVESAVENLTGTTKKPSTPAFGL